MKRVAFFSFSGTHTPTLASLAYFKPNNVQLDWFIHAPCGRYSEYLDSVFSVEQLGFKCEFLTKKSTVRLKNQDALKKGLDRFIFPKAKIKLQKEKVNVCVVEGNWWDYLLHGKPDGVVLPSVRLIESNFVDIFKKLNNDNPLFLHEYGNTLKSLSAFDLHKERHDFFKVIFGHGKMYVSQKNERGISTKCIMTGASKSDFYKMPLIFEPPTREKFIVYCSSISHVEIYDDRASQPNKWIKILQKSCSLAGYKLIVKLHPNILFLYNDVSWSDTVYLSSLSSDIFRQSSAVISDLSSIMLDAFLAKKPLFIPKVETDLPKYMKPMLGVVKFLTEDPQESAEILSSSIENFTFSKEHQKVSSMWWHLPNGKSSKRIWKSILTRI